MASDGDRDRSAPQPLLEETKTEDPKTKEIKKRVESWGSFPFCHCGGGTPLLC